MFRHEPPEQRNERLKQELDEHEAVVAARLAMLRAQVAVMARQVDGDDA